MTRSHLPFVGAVALSLVLTMSNGCARRLGGRTEQRTVVREVEVPTTRQRNTGIPDLAIPSRGFPICNPARATVQSSHKLRLPDHKDR